MAQTLTDTQKSNIARFR